MTSVVKCLVWDLDDTLWDGVVLEGDRPRPFAASVDTLRTLDQRGILHAVASRGDHATAAGHLVTHGLDDFFCVLDIGWGRKSAAVARISTTLNIGLDTVAFVDNDPVERSEVAAAHPEVRCYDVDHIAGLCARPEFQPRYVTEDARLRRRHYQVEHRRTTAEHEFDGSAADFLASLDLTMTVRAATEDDLTRAHELTVRTHQLNTTGLTFDVPALRELIKSAGHEVLVASLRDRFGGYGTIGLAVSELSGGDSVLLLLLMSCRVQSRGVGTVLLDHIVERALHCGRRPVARFVPTPVNQVMLVTLRFAGFRPIDQRDGELLLAVDPSRPRAQRPRHVRVLTEGVGR